MPAIVTSVQGDTVDLICFNHYGYTSGVTEQVLNNNPGLAALGVILPMGTKIELPDITARTQPKTINLWD
ncbi:MAG: tail protein X [Candidatus Pacearchaeota archaeon]|nr:tail protein X [Candidatus Pacearchaeota archaeon]